MVYFAPGILAIAVLLFAARLRGSRPVATFDLVLSGTAIGLGLLAFFAAPMAAREGIASLYGVAIGCLLCGLSGLLPDYEDFRGAIGFGIALIGIAAIQTPSLADSRQILLGLVGGAGLIRLLFPTPRLNGVLLATVILGVTHLFAKEVTASTGTIEPIRLSVAFAMVWLLVSVGEVFSAEKSKSMVRIGGGIIMTMLVLAFGRNLLGEGQLWQPGVLGLAAAGLTAWFISDADANPTPRIAASALLWLGLCTVATGFDRALGLPVMLFSGVTMLACLRRTDLLVTLAPVFAMTLFRVMRLADPEALRTIDLGQNYAVAGIIAGFLFVQIGTHITESYRREVQIAVGAACAGLVAASLIVMGGKGSVGLIIGASLACAMAVRNLSDGAKALAASLAAAGVTIGFHTLLMPYAGFDKTAKLQILIKVFVAVAIFAVAAVVLARSKEEVKSVHEVV